MVGDEVSALVPSEQARRARPFRPCHPPAGTVPAGACRLRLSMTLAHRPHDIRRLLAALASLASLRAPAAAPEAAARAQDHDPRG